MAGWAFPNALASSVSRTAILRGQHANRLEIRDPDDNWPPLRRVIPTNRCNGGANLVNHRTSIVEQSGRSFEDPFCATCGGLVTSR